MTKPQFPLIHQKEKKKKLKTYFEALVEVTTKSITSSQENNQRTPNCTYKKPNTLKEEKGPKLQSKEVHIPKEQNPNHSNLPLLSEAS